MVSDLQRGFRLGSWVIEPMRGAVGKPGAEPRHLEPKVMDVLVRLAARPNQLVTRNELVNAIWNRHVAADQLLTRAISELRRAFHDPAGAAAHIETVPKRGYRLIGEVTPTAGESPDEATHSPPGALRRRWPVVIPVAAALSIVIAFIAHDRFLPEPQPDRRPETGEAGPDTPAGAQTPATSIAVLPFVNMSDDPANEYLADGLSEEIRNLLARAPELKVIGRASSTAFEGGDADLRAIGRTLGVQRLLEGSVRKVDDRVRITTRLIDASDASQIWSQSYQRRMTDIFDLQDDVAAAIFDALRVRIGTYPRRGRPTEVAEAYALFLQARLALHVQDAQTAEAALRHAVELDPEFAEAYELLAHTYWTDAIPGLGRAEEQALISGAATRALALNEDLEFARALLLEADTENYSLHDVIEADKGVALRQPNNPAALRTLSWNLLAAGYLNEALQTAERLAEIDPLSQIAHIRCAAARRAVGLKEAANDALEAAYRLSEPGELDWYVGEMHLADNRDEEAIAHFEAAFRNLGHSDPGWVRALVTGGRDPASGEAHLDARIPEILASLPPAEADYWKGNFYRLYLFLGHIDRYLEITLASEPNRSTWTEAMYYVWEGTVYRDLGFTAHPAYLEVAARMGYIDVWEARGPPDFCEKSGDRWVCT